LRDLHSFPTRRSSDLAVPSPQKLDSLGLASALDCERRTVWITDAHRYGEALRCSRSPRCFRRAAVRSCCHEAVMKILEITVLLRSEEHTSELQSRGHL